MAVLVKSWPILDTRVKEEVIKGAMWVMKEDFGTTKLFIGFSISRVTNKTWPDINYIWFCPTGAMSFVLVTLNIIPLVEFIEGDVVNFLRTSNITLVERDGVWALNKCNLIRGAFRNFERAILSRRVPHWASKQSMTNFLG